MFDSNLWTFGSCELCNAVKFFVIWLPAAGILSTLFATFAVIIGGDRSKK